MLQTEPWAIIATDPWCATVMEDDGGYKMLYKAFTVLGWLFGWFFTVRVGRFFFILIMAPGIRRLPDSIWLKEHQKVLPT